MLRIAAFVFAAVLAAAPACAQDATGSSSRPKNAGPRARTARCSSAFFLPRSRCTSFPSADPAARASSSGTAFSATTFQSGDASRGEVAGDIRAHGGAHTGRGNLGELMQDMMAGVEAPSVDEAETLLAYLRKHSQRPLDAKKYPAVNLPEGQSFKLACQQCHVLPDPQRHKASEWPAVVARMEKNMEWMNRVVGNQPEPDEPQLKVEEINAFLVKYARKG